MSDDDVRTRALNRELTREMIVGVFIGSVFIVLVVFTIVISGTRVFQGGRTKRDVTFEKVGGLRRHDSVLVRGVPVGKVDRLHLADSGVDVRMALNEPVCFREGYRIKIQPTSLLGGMQLVIDEGTGDPLPPDMPLKGEPPDDMMADMGELARELRKAAAEGGILTSFRQIGEDLAEISGRLRRGEGTIGKLLSADDTLYRDLQETVADVRAIAGRLEKGEGTIGKLLSADDTLYRDLQETMADVRAIAGRLEKGEGTLGKLLSADDTLYRDLQETVADIRAIAGRLEKGEGTLGKLLSADDTLYRDLQETVANLRTITTRLEAGEGTLGQLLSKDAPLGREIEGLIKDARATIDDMREAAPITTFTSIFFGVF
jgi:phospholipid/cholesterol/gamma-HCH transport system substrate-binding protein